MVVTEEEVRRIGSFASFSSIPGELDTTHLNDGRVIQSGTGHVVRQVEMPSVSTLILQKRRK